MIPRLTKVAGFEWGSGFYINPVPPENAARFLREVDVASFDPRPAFSSAARRIGGYRPFIRSLDAIRRRSSSRGGSESCTVTAVLVRTVVNPKVPQCRRSA